MTKQAWGAALFCVVLAVGASPAVAAQGLRVLDEGYTTVLIGTEPSAPAEYLFPSGPQSDLLGNTYHLAGGAPGKVILKASGEEVHRFARVEGPGDPMVLGLWFDRNDNMIVVVSRRATHTPEERARPDVRPVLSAWATLGLERERAYYRIKGFADAAGATVPGAPAGLGTVLPLREGDTGALVSLLGFLCLAVTALVRQVQRDAHTLWGRR